MVRPPLRSLLAGLIDYAGLFPPAGLDMQASVAEFARHRTGPHGWMLGRFVVPAMRLDEFAEVRGEHKDEPWHLSVLVGEEMAEAGEKIASFGRNHGHLARVESVETKAETFEDIGRAGVHLADVDVFFEIPHAGDVSSWMAAISSMESGGKLRAAKIRTGGLTDDAIPSVSEVARFLSAARKSGVAFKATAGLHHPLRGEYPLTYEDDAPTATMHGYLNVFLAAAALQTGRLHESSVEELLEERDIEAFEISRRGISWHGREMNDIGLAVTRDSFALSFGSCSFAEPTEELKELGWL